VAVLRTSNSVASYRIPNLTVRAISCRAFGPVPRAIGGDLLVGNFGDGKINAFNRLTFRLSDFD
jgi:hypothetical protein